MRGNICCCFQRERHVSLKSFCFLTIVNLFVAIICWGWDMCLEDEGAEAGQAIEELLNLPDPVRDLALDQGGWSFAGPGVRNMTLLNEDGAKAELIRIEPGRGVPHHGHDRGRAGGDRGDARAPRGSLHTAVTPG